MERIEDSTGSTLFILVEVYLRDRSAAEFSHGICPECMKRLNR